MRGCPAAAQGARCIADGYDRAFIRDTMERDRDNVLTHLDAGSKIDRALGNCAPAWDMIGLGRRRTSGQDPLDAARGGTVYFAVSSAQ